MINQKNLKEEAMDCFKKVIGLKKTYWTAKEKLLTSYNFYSFIQFPQTNNWMVPPDFLTHNSYFVIYIWTNGLILMSLAMNLKLLEITNDTNKTVKSFQVEAILPLLMQDSDIL
jgi:hypothetical protein